jgi:hypothetical protein
MKNTMFPEIVNQMNKKNEKLHDITKLLNLKDISMVSRRLTGETGWTINEIETLCKHYNTRFEKLFCRKEVK